MLHRTVSALAPRRTDSATVWPTEEQQADVSAFARYVVCIKIKPVLSCYIRRLVVLVS